MYAASLNQLKSLYLIHNIVSIQVIMSIATNECNKDTHHNYTRRLNVYALKKKGGDIAKADTLQ